MCAPAPATRNLQRRARRTLRLRGVLVGLHGDAQRFWDRPRAALADEGDPDIRFDQKLVAAHDALAQHVTEAPLTSCGSVTTSSRSSIRAGLRNVRFISDTPRMQIPRRFLLRRLEQRAMVGADQPQIIRTPALHVAQIIGVIDNAGEVGVFVINAHGEMVAAVADFAVGQGYSESYSSVKFFLNTSMRPSITRTIVIRSVSTK